MNELISIIIPVYNHARELRHSFASILHQVYSQLEIIVVDDGSTDNFDFVIDGIIAKHANLKIKVIRQSNHGAASARNVGLNSASGQLVIFWDADTLARPDMLSLLKQALDAKPEGAYAYSDYKFGWKKMPSQCFNAADLKRNNYIDVTALIRREVLSPNPFDESLKRFQDWDLWLTLLENKKFGVYVPRILYKKIIGGRRRISLSYWLPGFVYKLPWKISAVRRYLAAKEIVLAKHGLQPRDKRSTVLP